MRGRHDPQVTMLAFVDLELRVAPDHPLRRVKSLADRALAELSLDFDDMYSEVGRPSIPPVRLRRRRLRCLSLCSRWAASVPFVSSWTTTSCSAGFWT